MKFSLRNDQLAAVERLAKISGMSMEDLVVAAVDDFICDRAGQVTVATQAAIINAKERGETPLTTAEIVDMTRHRNANAVHAILCRLNRSDKSGVTRVGYQKLGQGRRAALWDWAE